MRSQIQQLQPLKKCQFYKYSHLIASQCNEKSFTEIILFNPLLDQFGKYFEIKREQYILPLNSVTMPTFSNNYSTKIHNDLFRMFKFLYQCLLQGKLKTKIPPDLKSCQIKPLFKADLYIFSSPTESIFRIMDEKNNNNNVLRSDNTGHYGNQQLGVLSLHN